MYLAGYMVIGFDLLAVVALGFLAATPAAVAHNVFLRIRIRT